MTAPADAGPQLVPLPFQVRPKAGEGGPTFIRRLAQANHLPSPYLRKFLNEPPGPRGKPSWARLAAVTDRDPDLLRTTLETKKCVECGTDIPPSNAFGRRAILCSMRCKSRAHRRRQTTAPCRICQKPMKIQIGQRHRLCSSACRRTAYLLRQQGGTSSTASSADDDPAHQAGRRCIACEKPLPPGSRSHRQTCSAACRQHARRWSRLTSPELFLHPPAETCEFCQDPLPKVNSSAGQRRWCSYLCGQRARRGVDPGPYRIRTCEHCQEPIARDDSGRARRWCSRSCREKTQRRRRKAMAPEARPGLSTS